MNSMSSVGGGEFLVGCGADAVLTTGNAADLGDFSADLRCRKLATNAGLGALGDLDGDHLDVVDLRLLLEQAAVQVSVFGACGEVAGAELPDDAAAIAQLVLREATLARALSEAAEGSALVHGHHSVGGKGAEAHVADVVARDIVGLLAVRAADGGAERNVDVIQREC